MNIYKNIAFLVITAFIITVCDTANSSSDKDESSIEECNGSGEQSSGPCLVAEYAGTYSVSASTNTHDRGTVILSKNGAIDYDTNLQFSIEDYQGVYNRLDCCMRISVEMKQREDNDTELASDARHRVDIFTNSNNIGGEVVSFEYYPNWPSSQGKVKLSVE